uniref:Uncharacterized protein n=1 Tax=Xiphophorus maculatus TaxID=8083 RepID=A0A3B5Q627_XIPMA
MLLPGPVFSEGFTRKPTMTGSLSSEASTCSKENDQSGSGCSAEASWVEDASTEAAVLAGCAASAGGLLGSCSLRPTSSILRRRLVTWATARYKDSSSGWPWKML